jgi:hypothetical protein
MEAGVRIGGGGTRGESTSAVEAGAGAGVVRRGGAMAW